MVLNRDLRLFTTTVQTLIRCCGSAASDLVCPVWVLQHLIWSALFANVTNIIWSVVWLYWSMTITWTTTCTLNFGICIHVLWLDCKQINPKRPDLELFSFTIVGYYTTYQYSITPDKVCFFLCLFFSIEKYWYFSYFSIKNICCGTH